MHPIPARLVSEVERQLRERRVHGLALATFDRDGVCFGGGVGVADLDRGELVSPATVFRVASVSKLVTTAVVLRAVGAGALDLDEPVNDRLGPGQRLTDQAGAPAAVTLRHLLSHTAGLPASLRGADLGNRWLTRLASGPMPSDLAGAVTGLQVVRAPGERIVYANSGLNLAGHLASLALEVPFEVAAQREVLRPLTMASSAFDTSRHGPGVATPYGSIAPPGVSSRSAAAMQLVATPMGGLTTTVEDLARFGRMVLGGGSLEGTTLLDPALVAEATTLGARNHPDLEQGYGLGFKVRSWRGRRLVGHDGNMPGVASMVWLSPDDGVGVAVLTNGYALGIAHQVALLALEQLLGLEAGEQLAVDERDRADRAAFADRVAGRYRVQDLTPPGAVATLARFTTQVRLIHEARGLLRVEGNPGSDGPMWLRPEGAPGHYRVAAAVDDGTDAVFEERPDGLHLWVSQTTLLRPA